MASCMRPTTNSMDSDLVDPGYRYDRYGSLIVTPENEKVHEVTGVSPAAPSDLLSKRTILCFRVSFLNVFLLGLGFMLNVGAYSTVSMCQTVVLNSVDDEYFQASPTFGYVLWAISCACGGMAYLLGPSMVAVLGPKLAMMVGATCICIYVASFIRPLTIVLIITSILLGFGCNMMWQVQGHFVTVNSTTKRVSRNTGVFWILYQSSLVFGNLFYFFMVKGADKIDAFTRIMVFSVLTGVSVLGWIVLALVAHPWTEKIPRPPADFTLAAAVGNAHTLTPHRGPKEAFVALMRVFKTRNMIRLLPFFIYLGMEGTFWLNVYGTALGYTNRFGTMRQAMVGLTGVFAGVGEIIAGIMLGFLGKWMHFNGKDSILMLGMVVHIAAAYFTFINTPATASLAMTDTGSYIGPSPYLAMVVAFLWGLGDGIWNGQMIGYLGSTYRHDCVSVFACYQFWCAVSNTVAFAYATILPLPWQLLMLVIMSFFGAGGFCFVEWKALRGEEPD